MSDSLETFMDPHLDVKRGKGKIWSRQITFLGLRCIRHVLQHSVLMRIFFFYTLCFDKSTAKGLKIFLVLRLCLRMFYYIAVAIL